MAQRRKPPRQRATSRQRATPLTDLLIALCHDPEALRRFGTDPEKFLREEYPEKYPAITDEHREVLLSGSLRQIQDALRKESPEAYAGVWITWPNGRPITLPPLYDQKA